LNEFPSICGFFSHCRSVNYRSGWPRHFSRRVLF
jgi:hypothetical protein